MSEQLRKLAEALRVEQARRNEEKRTKCAQLVRAATGLSLLQRKLSEVCNGR